MNRGPLEGPHSSWLSWEWKDGAQIVLDKGLFQLLYIQESLEEPRAGGRVAAGRRETPRRLAEGGEGLGFDLTAAVLFCTGSLSSLKQEGGLYGDRQLDAAIAWYLWSSEEGGCAQEA